MENKTQIAAKKLCGKWARYKWEIGNDNEVFFTLEWVRKKPKLNEPLLELLLSAPVLKEENEKDKALIRRLQDLLFNCEKEKAVFEVKANLLQVQTDELLKVLGNNIVTLKYFGTIQLPNPGAGEIRKSQLGNNIELYNKISVDHKF